jgi:hypothetical protein
MLTVNEAFRKFKLRLELTDREQTNASQRHTDVREYVATKFAVERDFLTGSYARHTKTKPLKDIDIFFVLGASERHYRDKSPSVMIDAVYDALVEKYGSSACRKQGRSVNIDFGVKPDSEDKTDHRVLSIDVVPAFAAGDDFEIPCTDTGTWIKTNPKIHAEKAVKAHEAYSKEWKGLVRMIKYWNNNPKHGEKPVKPSFLLEVMALDCLYGPWGGQFDREVQALFATLADRIGDVWPDPAGLGPAISNGMDEARRRRATTLLLEAGRQATIAIDHVRKGRNGDALKAWRELFGPRFPLS